jgi:site-specific DNA-adenine methylase
MTAYHGGKQRIGKKLAKVIYEESMDIEDEYDFAIKGYCEPFAGMLGVYQHIPELFKDHKPKLKYKAGEINKSVVMMWNAVKRGWKPPTKTTEKEYTTLKVGKNSALKGYIGHQYSYGGQYFGGYAPKYGKTKDSKFVSDRMENLGKVLKKHKVKFTPNNYTQFSNLTGYVIYCDPPYDKTVQRYYNGDTRKLTFDHTEFWKWCKKMSKDNIVFVSSYNAPKDFSLVYSSLHKITGYTSTIRSRKRIEKLYMMY